MVIGVAASVALVVAGVLLHMAFQGRPAAAVVYPAAAIVAAAAVFFAIVTVRERGAPLFNLGGFAAAMIFVYAIYPIVVYLANGLTYTSNNDIRLWISMPVPEEIGALTWWYLIFFLSFGAAYLLTSGSGGKIRLDMTSAAGGIIWLIIALAGAIELITVATGSVFETSGGSYTETYAVVQRLPQFVRQIFVNAVSMRTTLLILVLCVLFSNYRRNRIWIFLLALWIVIGRLRAMGDRTELFIVLIACAFLYHNLVRRISIWLAVAGGILLLALSTWMAIAREGKTAPIRERAIGTSEFEAILVNAYDLRFVKHASGVMKDRPGLYFSDLTSLVPQQLLPFEKEVKSDWYLITYYPAARELGNGFAFGVLSEAVTGWGWPELIVRGVLIGILFGLFHRRIKSRPVSLWQLAFYLWLTVLSFQVIRNTSFGLLQWAEYHFFVPVIAIRIGHYLFLRGRLMRRRVLAVA
jgi:hypothetical protein